MTDPPLLIYEQTCHATLTNPRPGPRHALRAFPRPDLRRLFMDSQPAPADFEQDDGSSYHRVDPFAFPDFDDVASVDIVDAGAPLDDEVTDGGEH